MTTKPSGSNIYDGQDPEELMRSINHLLASVEEQTITHLDQPQLPTIFIIGPPRSATTLTYQLLAHWGGFGYISNFVARFWLAPHFGARLEQGLGLRSPRTSHRYVSDYGRTADWNEPHEFGYFWNCWFDLGQECHQLTPQQLQDVDRTGLQRSIGAIEAAYQQPIVFSNNTWCTFQVQFLARVFPKSLFVVCERDPLYVAQSILLGRRKFFGDDNTWWSVRPNEYPRLKSKPWWEQIAGQVYFTIHAMESGLKYVPQHQIVRVNYKNLCSDPDLIGREIVRHANSLGAAIDEDGHAPDHFNCTDLQRVGDEDFRSLQLAIDQYFKPARSDNPEGNDFEP